MPRVKLAAVRAIWGGPLLFLALNVPFLSALVFILFYPVYIIGGIPEKFSTSGQHVQIWFGGIQFKTLPSALFYFALCVLAAFVIGLVFPPKREPPSREEEADK